MKVALVKTTPDGNKRMFLLRDPKTVIGRGTLCHIRIALPSVADRHCEIRMENDGLHLLDLQSDSGTYVNGRPVNTATLSDNDELTIGPVRLVVQIEKTMLAPEPKTPSHPATTVSHNVEAPESHDAAAAPTARQRGTGA